MPGHDIIVIGASAGGIAALQTLFGGLPPGLAASFFVVQHLPPEGMSLVPAILERAGRYPVKHPVDGEPYIVGQVYVAPPDHHLLLAQRCMRVVRGPRENGFRPSIDALFRSAARFFGPRVIGVVLTGYLNDGALGLQFIRQRGGTVVVQDPLDSEYPSMPLTALRKVPGHACLALRDIPAFLSREVEQPAGPQTDFAVSRELDAEADIAEQRMSSAELLGSVESIGKRTFYTCPECNGAIWEIDQEGMLRYRCHVGHAFEAEAFLGEQTRALEQSLYTAVRVMEEKAAFLRQMAARMTESGLPRASERYATSASSLDRDIHTVRSLLNGATVEGG